MWWINPGWQESTCPSFPEGWGRESVQAKIRKLMD